MFTGIVEEMGELLDMRPSQGGYSIRIKGKKVLEGSRIGDSIATNGVCLTVTDLDQDSFWADIMAETLRQTNLGQLKKGDRVNLERALSLETRLGGHLLSGHIDCQGEIVGLEREGNAYWYSIRIERKYLKYIIERGSVAIDGISLTVAYVDDEIFKLSIIPHTRAETSLSFKGLGDRVNVELDMIGKYVERLLSFKDQEEDKAGIDYSFLAEHGFL